MTFFRQFLNGVIKSILFLGFYVAGLGTSFYLQQNKIELLISETQKQQIEIDELKRQRADTQEIRADLREIHREIFELKKYHLK